MAGHDHGAARQKLVRRGDAAPKDAPIPDRRTFLRIELFAHRGVNAVGGDQQFAFMGARGLAGRPVDEFGADAIGCFSPAGEVMTGEDILAAQPLGGGIEQDLLQGAAVDRELRPFVSGLDAALFAPDRLAVF